MPKAEDDGRYAYAGLERMLHERARLGLLIALRAHPEGLRFAEMKRLCSLTDGNLSQHLELLREEGIVEIWKGFENRRPQTLCRLSATGRRRLASYLKQLAGVMKDAAGSKRATRIPRPTEGWTKLP